MGILNKQINKLNDFLIYYVTVSNVTCFTDTSNRSNQDGDLKTVVACDFGR